MKISLSLLVILLMVDACWSSHCRWANWWTSFDKAGWSECDEKEYIRGFKRNGPIPRSDPISLLEEARCCKAPGSYQETSQTCENADWWGTLDGTNVWAECPYGYFVRDLLRSSGNGVSNIEGAFCCKPETLSGYGDCYDHTDVERSFDRDGNGRSVCNDGYYLTGIYKGSCNSLYCIEKFKCCKMT